MTELADDLRSIVDSAAQRLRTVPEQQASSPGLDGEWSARQVLGHLIDSAANNHQRFVRAQFVEDLAFPGYDQVRWVLAQHYDGEAWSTLVELWRLYNLHLAHIVDAIPEAVLLRPRSPHTLEVIAFHPVKADEPATLEYLIHDYIGHLQHHLAQLFALVGAARPGVQ
jgi:DinB superfamily